MGTEKILEQIRREIRQKVGLRMVIRAHYGCRRMLECEGTIDGVYSNIFTVQPADRTNKLSFSYSDVLTHNVVFEPLSTPCLPLAQAQ